MNNLNILPEDGEVFYHDQAWSNGVSDDILLSLINEIDWQHDEVMMFGKKIITRRKVAWYGDANYTYIYSKIAKIAQIWTPELNVIKARVEELSGEKFNSCLLNLYHDGTEAMSWHTDNEKMLRTNGTIASVSLGAVRKFEFKHKVSGEIIKLMLDNGSLLLMKGQTQKNWLHRLPPASKKVGIRVNLTFRQFNL